MVRRSFLHSVLLPDEGWLTFILMSLVALSGVWSIQVAAWVEGLTALMWIALAALVLGLLLAKLRLSGFLVYPLGLIMGVAIVSLFVAREVSASPLIENVTELWDRLQHWASITANGGVSTDNLLFLLMLGGIVWLTCFYGSWAIYLSREPWWLVLTSGAVLLVNLSYARTIEFYALAYLIPSILLIVRLNALVQEGIWNQGSVQFSAGLGNQFLRSAFVVALLVVVIMWIAPVSLATQQLTDAIASVSGPWQRAEGEFSRIFGGVRAKNQLAISGFSKALPLRGATQLSNVVVLSVVEDQAHYLRGVVYERYTGQGWTSPDRQATDVPAGDNRFQHDTNLLREDVTTTIKILQPRGLTVLAPAQPVRFSLPVSAEYSASDPDEADRDSYTDVSVLRSPLMLRRNERYTVVSSVSVADVQSLRQSGTEYPDWVKQRYLALPRIPQRVVARARTLTRPTDAPYDKAMSIQTFLRTYPYSDTVPAAPPGRDTVDFFLFDAKIGYCDYYASAMVVMLRLLGVPARVVSGYAPGDYDATQQAYLVRDSNAHAWPEVYFPRYGWVEFEPTASSPPPLRPQGPVPAAALATSSSEAAPSIEESDVPLVAPDEQQHAQTPRETDAIRAVDWSALSTRVAVPLVVLLFLCYMAYLLIWRRMFRGLVAPEATYGKMVILAEWLFGLAPRRAETPLEHASRLTALVPADRPDVQYVVEQFLRRRFGNKELAPDEATALKAAWRRLRGRLLTLFWRRPGRR